MDIISLWQATSHKSVSYPELTQQLEVDVAIIGAGITGITTALPLVKAGKKVAILEADRVGSGTTGSSTGNLYIPVQPFYQNIAAKFNQETAKTIAHSRKFAIDYIESTILQRNIQCNFSRRPWYAYTNQDEKLPMLEREVELLKNMDILIDYTKSLPLSLKFKRAAMLENQARFNPLQYVIALAADLQQQGCLIFEKTRVQAIEEKDICTLTTANGKVRAKKTVIATHTPIGINPTHFFTAPYRSYVVAVHLQDDIYPEGHFWDLDNSTHAICTHPITSDHPELLMVAGSHHKTGQEYNTAAHYNELEAYLRQHFQVASTAYRWSAQHYHAADTVPYIGLANRFSKHIYMGTGFFADGLIYGTLAGIIVSDLILEKNNPLAQVYNANRFTLGASADFLLKENMNVFLQYLHDYPLFSKPNYAEIKVGEGKIVEIDREKCAVSRDDKNQLHIVSAVCTHMKCIVHWNNAEKTWDCPCHGSRFTQGGQVIEGPAQKNLARKNVE